VVAHLPAGAKKGAESRSCESAANADPLDADCRKGRNRQLRPPQPHHHIHRPIDRADHGGDVFLRSQAGRIAGAAASFCLRLCGLERAAAARRWRDRCGSPERRPETKMGDSGSRRPRFDRHQNGPARNAGPLRPSRLSRSARSGWCVEFFRPRHYHDAANSFTHNLIAIQIECNNLSS